MKPLDLSPFRDAIIAAYPNLQGHPLSVSTAGWDSIAIDIDNRLVFKFPRQPAGERALIREARLLSVVRPAVSVMVPDLRIHQGPPLFSVHGKLKGEHLLSSDYDELAEEDRHQLGEALGRFYSELHGLDQGLMIAAGAGRVAAWQTPEAVRARALPALSADVRGRAADVVAEFERLPPDPHGVTYGFFDGHGWNMAFDHTERRLKGIYDFGDSGLGPVHQEFIYSNFISPDLTERIISAYERRTAREIDRRRVALLTGYHRLSELAELAESSTHLSTVIRNVELWAEMAPF